MLSDHHVFWLVAYAAGYCVLLGYALNRFCDDMDDPSILVQGMLALLWPICVAIYAPYRLFRWLDVSR